MAHRSPRPAAVFASLSLVALASLHCGTETTEVQLGPPASFSPSPAGRRTDGPPASNASTADGGLMPSFDGGPKPLDGSTPPTSPPTPPPGTPPAKPDGGNSQQQPPPGGDPCATVTCGTNETCVPYAHGQPLGVCVGTCDCNNCGNCGGDNADGRWDDMQEYCGNPGASPATKTCTRGCGGGLGCIPFGATSICWPLEGCFSL